MFGGHTRKKGFAIYVAHYGPFCIHLRVRQSVSTFLLFRGITKPLEDHLLCGPHVQEAVAACSDSYMSQIMSYLVILLMEEILHHLKSLKSSELQYSSAPRWCKISSINSISIQAHSQILRGCLHSLLNRRTRLKLVGPK